VYLTSQTSNGYRPAIACQFNSSQVSYCILSTSIGQKRREIDQPVNVLIFVVILPKELKVGSGALNGHDVQCFDEFVVGVFDGGVGDAGGCVGFVISIRMMLREEC
jgi:hypothetical protein